MTRDNINRFERAHRQAGTNVSPFPTAVAPPGNQLRRRFVRPIPPEVLAKAMADDEALNALRRKASRSYLLDWLCVGVAVLVAVYFVGQLVRGAISGALL